jgi:hypothetical protein
VISRGALLFVALFPWLFGCQGQGEKDRELSRLSRAVDKLREAENVEKSVDLDVLRRSSCTHHCRLRALCLSAYDSHHEALVQITRARTSSLDPKGGEVAQQILREAEARLVSALKKMQECASLQAELKRGLKAG